MGSPEIPAPDPDLTLDLIEQDQEQDQDQEEEKSGVYGARTRNLRRDRAAL